MFYGLKIGAKTHFKTRSLPKLVFIKLQGHSVVIPLVFKTKYFFNLFFKTPLRKPVKGDIYISNSFWKKLQKPYSLI
jgi:hypothetical protein